MQGCFSYYMQIALMLAQKSSIKTVIYSSYKHDLLQPNDYSM
uniref:Uncharacterized protein n=1 Tax=Rheinheimera sp. BAL341 TaxID=1708203 RepID=A0A486XWY1_9GAMM